MFERSNLLIERTPSRVPILLIRWVILWLQIAVLLMVWTIFKVMGQLGHPTVVSTERSAALCRRVLRASMLLSAQLLLLMAMIPSPTPLKMTFPRPLVLNSTPLLRCSAMACLVCAVPLVVNLLRAPLPNTM